MRLCPARARWHGAAPWHRPKLRGHRGLPGRTPRHTDLLPPGPSARAASPGAQQHGPAVASACGYGACTRPRTALRRQPLPAVPHGVFWGWLVHFSEQTCAVLQRGVALGQTAPSRKAGPKCLQSETAQRPSGSAEMQQRGAEEAAHLGANRRSVVLSEGP